MNQGETIPKEKPRLPPQGMPPVDPNGIRQQYEAGQGLDVEFCSNNIQNQNTRNDATI